MRGPLALTAAVAAAVLATGFRDGPPARVTGGFGEDSCIACHYEDHAPPATGIVRLDGLPDRFTPGETYRLSVILEHADMLVAGFQLAMRHPDDPRQAGTFEPPDGGTRPVSLLSERDIQFVQHGTEGADVEDGTASWAVLWTAPDSTQPVVAHVAAVAGDGDESQVGDAVYTLERTVEPERPVAGTE